MSAPSPAPFDAGPATPLLILEVLIDGMVPGDAILLFNATLGSQTGGNTDGTFATVDGPQGAGTWAPETSTTLRVNVGPDLQSGGAWTITDLVDFVVPAGYTFTLPQSGTLT